MIPFCVLKEPLEPQQIFKERFVNSVAILCETRTINTLIYLATDEC